MQIVSLITDYGTQDYYLAELKTAIYRRAGIVQLLDVSHRVESHDISTAAYFLENIIQKLPKGSIHIVSVNNYYIKKPDFLVFKHTDQYFVGPDNGLFSLVFEDFEQQELFKIEGVKHQISDLKELYAHTVASIVHGFPLSEIGNLHTTPTLKLKIRPVINSDHVRATIIHIDHYENVIINLKKEDFMRLRNGRSFYLYYKQHDPISQISNHYADVPTGEVLCRFNSMGYLELAINMGRAASMLNLAKNETIQIDFR